MLSAISLLVLACAITINAQGHQRCSEAKIGNVPTSHAVKLRPVNLQPFQRDWEVIVPRIDECVYGVSGVQVFICDSDEAPTGYFTDFHQLKVHRNGNLRSDATVTVTVYCVL